MKLQLTIVVLLSLVVWKSFRTDWIVECESASADFHPPVSVDRFIFPSCVGILEPADPCAVH